MFGKFNKGAASVLKTAAVYGRAVKENNHPKTIQQWYNSASPIWMESKEAQ